MHQLPVVGPRYWVALCLASVFGANMGDFVAHILHLGHASGLLPLGLIFAGIMLVERRSTFGNAAYYWAAILTLRTAATNLADLATHDFKLSPQWLLAALTALLYGLLRMRRSAKSPAGDLPDNDANYWGSMLLAGTLGTVLGDSLADNLGLGVGPATLMLSLILAALFGLRSPYWMLVVAIRTAGTTLGDWIVDSIGLVPSTLITGLAFVGVLWLWSTQLRFRWKKPIPAYTVSQIDNAQVDNA